MEERVTVRFADGILAEMWGAHEALRPASPDQAAFCQDSATSLYWPGELWLLLLTTI